MNPVAGAALAVIGGFWIGAIPFGVIVGTLVFGRDIRAEGSGNIGAANALRTFGRAGAALARRCNRERGSWHERHHRPPGPTGGG